MKISITLLLLIFPLGLSAQTSPKVPLWRVTFHIGPFASSLPDNMEEQMRSQGYQPYKGILGSGPPLDMTYNQPVFQLGLEKALRQKWFGKVLVSRTKSYTKGISSQEGDLRMGYQIFTSAFLSGYHSK